MAKEKKPLSAGILVRFLLRRYLRNQSRHFFTSPIGSVLFLAMIAADRGSRYEIYTIYTESHTLYTVKKIPSTAGEDSAYEYELSIHLICHHNSMLYQDTHAIYPAWDFFVFLLGRKAGNMEYFEQFVEHIEYAFRAFCKVVLRHEAINAWRDLKRKEWEGLEHEKQEADTF